MNASMILFGIIPLIAFVIIDSFSGLKAGVIAGVLFALAEIVYSLVFYKSLDELTLCSTVLILIFGFLSYKSKKDIYFKMQPVVVGLVCSAALMIMQYLGNPLLVVMIKKYYLIFPTEMQEIVLQEEYLKMMARLSGVLAWGFLVHAALVAFSAFRMSKWWWLVIRGIGFYVMLFACALWVRFTS